MATVKPRGSKTESFSISNPEMDYYAFWLISAWSNVPQFKLEGFINIVPSLWLVNWNHKLPNSDSNQTITRFN